LFQALQCLRRLRPVCALGMGGYVAGPAGLAARLLGVPLVIHEQNSVAGTTNRLLRRFARRVLTAYPGAFAGSPATEQVGNPVRAELLQRGERIDFDYTGQRPLRLLVVGGSQGAQAINELVPAALALLPATCLLDIRHQTGPAHSDVVTAAYEKETDSRVEVLPFIEDMASAYAWADLVLCRAGALTVAELTIMSRPSILVPLPQAIDNHQAHNAEWLTEQGACLLMPQSELSPRSLADTLIELAAQPQRLAAMASAAAAAARPQATRVVADICEEVRREP
jgi:UDP-N-acetylglucosamine--N-acetylmuramyl-(pentapeptide) pyrophosphoryl-undecaprenol N-acetylglucosamine transferase